MKTTGSVTTTFDPLFSHAFSLKAVNSLITYQLPKNSKSSRKHLAVLVYSRIFIFKKGEESSKSRLVYVYLELICKCKIRVYITVYYSLFNFVVYKR